MPAKRRAARRRPSGVNRFLNGIRHRSIAAGAGDMALSDLARAARSKLRHAPNGTAVQRQPRNIDLIGFEQTFWKDVFYSCVSMSWARFLCLTIVCYMIVIGVFAALFMIDLEECVYGALTFSDAFYFSVHTLSTIGYGNMYPQCQVSHAFVGVESLVSILMTSVFTGMVYSKFSKATPRILFSDVVVVNPEAGEVRVRIANLRANDVFGGHASVVFVYPDVDDCGEVFYNVVDLELVRSTTPFFTHLWVIKHKIEGGPFEHMTEEKLKHDKSRIFVTFEGMDSVMHDSIYVQKTYTSDEIRFNSKFRSVLYNEGEGDAKKLTIDLTRMHETQPCDMCLNPLDVANPVLPPSKLPRVESFSSIATDSTVGSDDAVADFSAADVLDDDSSAGHGGGIPEVSALDPLPEGKQSHQDVVELDASTFSSEVMMSSHPWLVYFYEHGSKACHTFKPLWRGTAARLSTTPMRCGQVENTRAPDVLEDFHLAVLPAVVMLRAGLDNKHVDQCVKAPGIKKATAMLYQLEEELRVGHYGKGSAGGATADLAVGIVGAHRQSRATQLRSTAAVPRRAASSPELRSAAPPSHGPIMPPPLPPPPHADIVQLTDETFDGAVMAALDPWVVLFWKVGCKSCDKFKPTFKAAAGRLASSAPDVHVAMIEQDNTSVVSRFKLPGFPALAVFPAGAKSIASTQVSLGMRAAGKALKKFEALTLLGPSNGNDDAGAGTAPRAAASGAGAGAGAGVGAAAGADADATGEAGTTGDANGGSGLAAGTGSSRKYRSMRIPDPRRRSSSSASSLGVCPFRAAPSADVVATDAPVGGEDAEGAPADDSVGDMCPFHAGHPKPAHPAVGLDLCAPEYDGLTVQVARPFAEALADGFKGSKVQDMLRDKTIVLFGLPGAFTGVCSQYHVPSYTDNHDAIMALGVDAIYCLSVNDPFVMQAWAEDMEVGSKLSMIADGFADLTKALSMDTFIFGGAMGLRSKRFSMVVHNGVVQVVNLEASGDDLEVSDGESMVKVLKAWRVRVKCDGPVQAKHTLAVQAQSEAEAEHK